MQEIKQFLQGKKTYLSATAIALTAICGWWFGTLDNTQAVALLSVAGAAAGLGAKSQRTAETVLTTLADLRQAQAKNVVGQKIDPRQLATDVAKNLFSSVMSSGFSPKVAASISNIPVAPSAAAKESDAK
jgi:hypothetical protein